jgi:hypothetical protein
MSNNFIVKGKVNLKYDPKELMKKKLAEKNTEFSEDYDDEND